MTNGGGRPLATSVIVANAKNAVLIVSKAAAVENKYKEHGKIYTGDY